MQAKITNCTSGSIVINDTALHVPPVGKTYGTIDLLTNTVFEILSGDTKFYENVTFPAPRVMQGNWNQIKLTSGSAIVYYF